MNINELSDLARSRIAPEHRKELGMLTAQEIEVKNDSKSERDLQNQIADFLRAKNIVASVQRMDRKSNLALGMADFLLCYHSTPLAFECKVGNSQQTKEQREMEIAMTKNGWNYYVIRNLSQVRVILTAIEISKEK